MTDEIYEKAKKARKDLDAARKAIKTSPECKIYKESRKIYNEAWNILEATDAYKAYEEAREVYAAEIERALNAARDIVAATDAYKAYEAAREVYFEGMNLCSRSSMMEMEDESDN